VVDAGIDDPGHDPLPLRRGEAAGRGAVVDAAGSDPRGTGVGQQLATLVRLHALHAGQARRSLGLARCELHRHAVERRAIAERHGDGPPEGAVQRALDGLVPRGEMGEVGEAVGARGIETCRPARRGHRGRQPCDAAVVEREGRLVELDDVRALRSGSRDRARAGDEERCKRGDPGEKQPASRRERPSLTPRERPNHREPPLVRCHHQEWCEAEANTPLAGVSTCPHRTGGRYRTHTARARIRRDAGGSRLFARQALRAIGVRASGSRSCAEANRR
jgi:hypothetical protein